MASTRLARDKRGQRLVKYYPRRQSLAPSRTGHGQRPGHRVMRISASVSVTVEKSAPPVAGRATRAHRPPDTLHAHAAVRAGRGFSATMAAENGEGSWHRCAAQSLPAAAHRPDTPAEVQHDPRAVFARLDHSLRSPPPNGGGRSSASRIAPVPAASPERVRASAMAARAPGRVFHHPVNGTRRQKPSSAQHRQDRPQVQPPVPATIRDTILFRASRPRACPHRSAFAVRRRTRSSVSCTTEITSRNGQPAAAGRIMAGPVSQRRSSVSGLICRTPRKKAGGPLGQGFIHAHGRRQKARSASGVTLPSFSSPSACPRSVSTRRILIAAQRTLQHGDGFKIAAIKARKRPR